MKNNNRTIRNTLTQAFSLLVPIGLFCLILSINIPDALIRFQNQFQITHFFILTILFFLCFRAGGRWGWTAGCALAAALFALHLASKWSLGVSNANIIGGFIPYKDGFYYYNGARMLLTGQSITADGLQGAFRPLFPGMLSALLLLTRGNLMCVIAIIVLLVAVCTYLAAQSLNTTFGPLPAAVLMVLQFAFIRPMIGYSLTELPSLLFSCLAFILLLKGADSKRVIDIALGSLMLVIGISVRAGAFFVLPILIVWTGWVFKKENRWAFKQMVLFGLLFSAEFLAVNFLFPRLVTAAGSSTFGNFSWMLYGQAVGGAGWIYHVQALGTNDPAIVLQAAIDKILTYPLGLAIGVFKSLRDFFLPGATSMFDLISYRHKISNDLFWLVNICLLVWGLVHSIRRIKEPIYSLLLSCFLGTFLSIPFLPPIDGGNRFYSGIVPFFFAVEAVGLFSILSFFKLNRAPGKGPCDSDLKWLRVLSVIMAALILAAPIGVKLTKRLPSIAAPACHNNHVPYAAYLEKGTYIDIVPSNGAKCGLFPVVCLVDFEKNGVDKNNDDFFQKLVELAAGSTDGIRVSASVDLISSKYYFTVYPIDSELISGPGPLYTGCAQEIKTQYQTILLVKTYTH